jgi:hypothetical protein
MEKRRKAETSSAGCVISVRVLPRSSTNAVIPLGPGSYRVKLTSPPIEGAANKQLVEVLAERLSVAPGKIEIISGSHSRLKRIKLHGITEAEQARLLSTS